MWSTPHVWEGLRSHFEALGHATSAPTLPLHDVPPSDAPPEKLGTLGIGDYVDTLVADARSAPSSPVIIGHSMGGMLAQLVAEKVQPRGLVLLSPAGTATTSPPAWSPIRTMAGVMTARHWWKSPTRIDRDRARWGIFNEVPAEIAEREIDALVWDSGRVLFQMALPWADKAKAATVDYSRLTMPALIVVGEEDRITPVSTARATARAVGGPVDYRELPGVGHWLFHEPVAGTVAAAIETYLTTV